MNNQELLSAPFFRPENQIEVQEFIVCVFECCPSLLLFSATSKRHRNKCLRPLTWQDAHIVASYNAHMSRHVTYELRTSKEKPWENLPTWALSAEPLLHNSPNKEKHQQPLLLQAPTASHHTHTHNTHRIQPQTRFIISLFSFQSNYKKWREAAVSALGGRLHWEGII